MNKVNTIFNEHCSTLQHRQFRKKHRSLDIFCETHIFVIFMAKGELKFFCEKV